MITFDFFKKSVAIPFVAAALSLGLSLPANATLIGDTITITSTANLPVDTWTDTVIVGAGNELDGNVVGTDHVDASNGQKFAALFAGDFIDVGANSITFNFAAFTGGFLYAFKTDFLDLDWTDMPGILQGVTLATGATGLIGWNIENVTADSFEFQGTVDLVNGANFTLDLTADHSPNPVPEPASILLFGVGLLGMSCARATGAKSIRTLALAAEKPKLAVFAARNLKKMIGGEYV